MGVQVPAVTTSVTADDMRGALSIAWEALWGETPKPISTLVLAAHFSLETGGGKSCKCWNIGNKKARKDGSWGDWCTFQTWEIVSIEQADKDAAKSTDNEPCRKVPGSETPNGKVKVVYGAGHPVACFRAYPNLESGTADYLTMIHNKFNQSWQAVSDGDPRAYAAALKKQHYYTAAQSEYEIGMVNRFYTLASRDRMTTPQQVKDGIAYLGFKDIQSFQGLSGLTSDGVAGPVTRGALALAVDAKQNVSNA